MNRCSAAENQAPLSLRQCWKSYRDQSRQRSSESNCVTSMMILQVRALHSSTSAGRLVPPSLRANKARSEKSRLFSVLAPQWWNDLPTNIRTAESLSVLSQRLKTHLFRLHLDPAEHDSLPTPLKFFFFYVHTCMFVLSAHLSQHLCTYSIFGKQQLQSSDEGLRFFSIFLFTPLM